MAQAMERIFLELGGNIRLSTPVDEILVTNGKACGVRSGTTQHADDIVLCNADFAYAIPHSLPFAS